MTKKKLRTNDSSQGAEAAEDARFSSAMNAPIFGKVGGRDSAKVQIDERFQSILTDDRFRVVPGGAVDAFGRKKKQSKQKDVALQELNRLYKIDSSAADNTAEDAGEGEEETERTSSAGKAAKKAKKGAPKPTQDEDRLDYLTKLARGEIDASSSSSAGESDASDGESEDEEGSGVFAGEEEDEEEEDEDDEDVVETFTKSALAVPEEGELEYGDATHRVSILNCDWENIKAQDLMVILQSFVPPGRSVRSVTVYPSDFGKQRMAEDELHGPQGIWKAKKDESEEDEEEEEEEESENESESEGEDHSVTSKKKNKDQSSSSKKKKKNDGFDAQRLREYELSKLRYFFAIADCDSAFTANALYEELDDVELQDSAMALELRFVPDDLDLSDREIRDQCFGVPDNYKPPDFVVNALQHTNVQCTWDEGEREREKKLTNLNAWRGMRDSDFMQYIASSDSDDEEEEVEIESDDSEAEGSAGAGSMMSVSRKKARAQSLRALLLGDAAGEKDSDEDEDDEQDSAAHGQDDFFMQEDDDEDDEGGVSKRSGEDEEEEMVLTYMPEAGQELLEKKRDRETEASLTPLELSLRKEAEKKKERKTLRKMVIEERKQAQKEQLEKVLGKKKGVETEEEKKQRIEERERLQKLLNIRDGEDEDEERLGLSGTKKTKKNRKRGKAAQAENDAAEEAVQRKQDKIGGGSFEVDVTDERFKKVFEGDAVFGIERTAHEFKQTPGMQKILEAQRKNRTKKQKKQRSGGAENDEASAENKKDMSQLVNRLKRKFQE